MSLIFRNKHKIKKIAVFRALQLGDLLCSVPAFRALRKQFPDAEISLIGLPWAEAFVKRFKHYFDCFIHFPGYVGLPEQPYQEEKYLAFEKAMQKENFDLLLQMQGNGSIVNELLERWNAKCLVGFTLSKDKVTERFCLYPDNVHEINRHLQLIKHLGITDSGTALEYPVTLTDKENYRVLSDQLCGPHIVIHPGSRGSYRQWPTINFAKIADIFYAGGFNIVITGTANETKIVDEVIEKMQGYGINMCGKTDFGTIGLLIKNASLIVCNCTGVSHIASAMQTPGVIISMDGEPDRWAPLNHNKHRTINWLTTQDFDHVIQEANCLLSHQSPLKILP